MQRTIAKQVARTHTLALVIALGVLASSSLGFAALSATGRLDRAGSTDGRAVPVLITTDAATQDQLLEEYARYNPVVDGARSQSLDQLLWEYEHEKHQVVGTRLPAMEQLLIEYETYNPVVE